MKILIAIDIAHRHEDLIEHIDWLLPLDGAEAVLLVVEQEKRLQEDLTEESMERDGRQDDLYLQRTKKDLEKCGVRVSLIKRSGISDVEIVRCADTMNADLVVVSPSKHTAMESLMQGSVSRRVANLAKCTTVLLQDSPHPDGLKHVLFGTDSTESSLISFKNAVELFKLRERDVAVTLLHVVPEQTDSKLYSFSPIPPVWDLQETLRTIFEKTKDFSADDFDVITVTGDPATEILRVAEERKVQLIVIGKQIHSAEEHFVFGTVSIHVFTSAKCSVLIAS